MNDPEVRRTTRLALVGLPGLVSGMLAALINSWEGFEVCARLSASTNLLGRFEASSADVLICAITEPEMDTAWRQVLRATPRPAVINLVDGYRAALTYQLRDDRAELCDLSADRLRTVLETYRTGGETTDR